MLNQIEKTLVMIKPNTELYTSQNQDFFREKIFQYTHAVWCIIEDEKDITFTEQEAQIHYKHLVLVHFFQEIVDYITSGNSHLMLISGENAISKMNNFKKILRKDFGCHPWLFDWIYNKKPIYNIIHTSDSQREAKRETHRYFEKSEY